MSQANLTKSDKPRTGDGLKSLFSKRLNRLANIGDLQERLFKVKDRTITVYFKPYNRTLYVPNSSIHEAVARAKNVGMIRMFNTPHYDARALLDNNLIDEVYVERFNKRTNDLIQHFIDEWIQ